jgi:hypothetical protein
MALFIPENPKSKNSLGENRALALLQGLSDDWIVFHSVAWSAPKNYKKAVQGEIDLLVFHPQKGILVVEVKGGAISTAKGKWYSTGRDGVKREIKNPAQQAGDNKFAFRQHLKERVGEEIVNKLIVGHAVWFPECAAIAEADYPLDWKPQWTLFNDAVHYPEGALSVALDKWREILLDKSGKGTVGKSLTEEEATRVVLATAPTFSATLVHGVGAQLREMRFVRLTENQNRILDYVEDVDFISVYGSAGTGKTLLAVEMCKRFAEAGEKTLFLCYNRLLKEKVNTHRKGLPPEAQKLWDVHTFDALALSLCGISVPTTAAGWDEAKEKLIGHLKAGGAFPYHHVVVDEAQDFDEEWLKILKKRALGKFAVFFDPQQMVYSEGSDLPQFFSRAEVKLKLPYNMRNTIEIARTGYGFAHLAPKTLAPVSGPKPKFYVYQDETTRVNKVREILERWRVEYGPENVMVAFLGRKPANYLLCGYKFADGTMPALMDTVLRLKGLEAAAVILPEADLSKLKTKSQRNRLYVAATRAKHELALFVKEPRPDVLKEISDIYEIEFLDGINGFSNYFEGELMG